jgi:hypothetical protein
MSLTHGDPQPTERGGLLPMSTVDTASCQQSGHIAQVLMQAFGLRTRLSKNYIASQRELTDYGLGFPGGPHVSNVVTLMGPEGERTYMVDTHNPQSKDGKWKPGIYRMDNQLPDGGWLVTGLSGTQRKYTERPDDMYWIIGR